MQKILFIDAYDSFSNSIVTLLRVHLDPVEVVLIHIDDPRFFVLNDDDAFQQNAFQQFLRQFSGVVVGPGPGHPANAKDVGLIDRIWKLSAENVLPVLGICLGFQSLCLAFGGRVSRLNVPRHGRVTRIQHKGGDLFAGTGEVSATLYHSLRADLGCGKVCSDADPAAALWMPSETCSEILPLAWDLDDGDNGSVLMAARHRSLPFWGVQYHPESICTCDEGRRVVESWWREACAWNQLHQRAAPARIHKQLNGHAPHSEPLCSSIDENAPSRVAQNLSPRRVSWRRMKMEDVPDTARVVDLFRSDTESYPPILLESGQRNGNPVNPETGRFSILGFHDAQSTHIRYSTSSHTLTVARKGVSKSFPGPVATMYQYLESFIKRAAASDGPEVVPFWGGLVGYISYEAGLEGIGLSSANDREDRPDVWFIMVERSIVIDHATGNLYLQTLREDDNLWLCSIEKQLSASQNPKSRPIPQSRGHLLSAPVRTDYCGKVRDCQAELRAGCSYELCLTDQTLVSTRLDSWNLYRRLRQLNPAPFGAYLRFAAESGSHGRKVQGLEVVSSSPERFLYWSRDGKHQFRPIKGTIKKGPNVDRSVAEEVLGSPKEQAENLMIVDLIRHDLNGVALTGTVRVPKLMTIEEYETVFQLVSVIEGDLAPETSGISSLAASLPPGSMTGAPKKRSCELLQSIEGQSSVRGLYSGVIGYLDVGGGGDFSVVIRTAFKWEDQDEWRIGAGGAVTVLSEEEAEFEEMAVKRESLLRAFDVTLREH